MKNALSWLVLGIVLVPTAALATYDFPIMEAAKEDINKQIDWLKYMLDEYGVAGGCGTSVDIVFDHGSDMFDLNLNAAKSLVDIGCSLDTCRFEYLDYMGAAEMYLNMNKGLVKYNEICNEDLTVPSYTFPSSTSSKATVKKLKSSSSSSKMSSKSSSSKKNDVNCGEHGYYSAISGCRCDNGYKRSGGSCTFVGCPTGTTKQSDGTCKKSAKASNKSLRVQCIAKNPCVCPDGYQPLGNKICSPK